MKTEKILQGHCLGGLVCDGGCCRHRIYSDSENYVEQYCEHYDSELGICKIYDTRSEKGYSGCVAFPENSCAVNFGLPEGCGYYFIERIVEE